MVDIDLPNNIVVRGQVYSLALPFLSFDASKPVTYEAVNTTGRTGSYPAMTQIGMFDAIVERLGITPPLKNGLSPGASAAHIIRESMLSRQVGHSGPSDTGQQLYDSMRQGIIDHLALRDADGKVRMGCEDTGAVLTSTQAWQFEPTLRQQSGNR